MGDRSRLRSPASSLRRARGLEAEKVRGLSSGADDYVIKPFGSAELVARIQALLRRARRSPEATAPTTFDDGWLRVDLAARSVHVTGLAVELTPLEYRVLAALVEHADSVLSPEQLLKLAGTIRSASAPSGSSSRCHGCGQHQDGHVAHVTDALDHRPSVEVGQPDVEDHDIGVDLVEQPQPLASGARLHDLELGAVQQGTQQHPDVGLVLDDQDRGGAHRPPSLPSGHGNVAVTMVPWPSTDEMSSQPPCSSTIASDPEPEAGPRGVLLDGIGCPVEARAEVVQLGAGHADAVIADPQDPGLVGPGHRDRDVLSTGRCELHGVVDQVAGGLLQARCVEPARRAEAGSIAPFGPKT
jgi:hypothetical protein